MAPKKRQRASPAASASASTPETLTVKAAYTSADSLREALTKMWRSDTLCDVEIKIEGRSFSAHRVILAAESPYLSALVTTTMKERSGPIELKEIGASTFASALEFMYLHECKLASQDELQPLLHAASLLRLPLLEAAVETAIAQRLDPSSALQALGLAEHLSLPVLASAATKIVLAHFEEAMAVQGGALLATLSADKLGEMLSADQLVIRCACPWAPACLPPLSRSVPLAVTSGWSSRRSRGGSSRRQRHLPRRHAACSGTCASPAWPRNASCNWRRTS